MIVVLLVSTGESWESRALAALADHPGTVLLKRCVDVADLLAAARTGQAEAAVLAVDLPGLDQGVVDELRREGVRVLGVADDPGHTAPRAARLGVATVLSAARVDELGPVLAALPDDDLPPPPATATTTATIPRAALPPPAPGRPGRVLAVWGPGGAPGRTTLATGLAGELARRGLSTLLVDADPYGGAVAQQLGILDEVSGLLAATRLAAAGSLDERFAATQRRLTDQLRLLTGLPRPDRWPEVRAGALAALLERARHEGQVVVDTGFALAPDPYGDPGGSARPDRDSLTREALEAADDVVLVGAADPVGLARLARALGELDEHLPGTPVRVVVNRMRSTLGWREADVVGLLDGIGRHEGVHFLPDDQAAVDRALVAGRLLVESGDSALRRALARLVDALAGVPARR
ncbi:AAA family ATPase [Pimelobacter simplex]|uniref:Flagellar synthesis regulator FleN n=1 Tax=Nocardioides simplex TaxID=2045 RepID=A0A0A1DNA7_NOCSI|nr:hypothetical protein [Pimelobacter simplex]AIY16880.1 Flagellar synthesis regulator FleN [Pimelobacter simplex]GEB12751.1 pilus biosynthesis protein CpaE [Pimelobacter simplex]SFM54903.1 CobQ/CobB/MinD/ParA nucleotide binding domain-containing protein [Pimelobacter simplex]